MANNIVRELGLEVFVDMNRVSEGEVRGKEIFKVVLPTGEKIKNSVRYPLYEEKMEKNGEITCKYCGKYATVAKLENSGEGKPMHMNVYAEDGDMFSAMLNMPKTHGGKRVHTNMSVVCKSCMKVHEQTRDEVYPRIKK